MEEWKQQVDVILEIIIEIGSKKLEKKYKMYMMDKMLRIVSDIISSESLVTASTYTNLRTCRRWSKGAVNLYNTIKEEITSTSGQPVNRSMVIKQKINGKHIFVVEHEYPLLIPKTGVLEKNWDTKTLREWMYNFSKITVITKEEDLKLTKTSIDMETASKRYINAGIEILDFCP